MDLRLFEHRLGPLERPKLLRAGPDDHQGPVDDPPEHPAIGEPQHGRAVEDHAVVVVFRERQQELAKFEAAEHLDRHVACVARGQEVEVRQVGLHHGPLPGEVAPQDVDQAGAFLIAVEDVVEAGPAEVHVHEEGPLAGPGAGRGQVEGGRALPLAGLGAGDEQGHERLLLRGRPEQAGAEVPVGVGLDRIGRAGRPEVAAPVVPGVAEHPGDHAEEGQAEPQGQVFGDLDGVVDVLQEADQGDTQAEAEDDAGGDERGAVRALGDDRLGRLGPDLDRLLLRGREHAERRQLLGQVGELLRLVLTLLHQRGVLVEVGHRVLHLGQHRRELPFGRTDLLGLAVEDALVDVGGRDALGAVPLVVQEREIGLDLLQFPPVHLDGGVGRVDSDPLGLREPLGVVLLVVEELGDLLGLGRVGRADRRGPCHLDLGLAMEGVRLLLLVEQPLPEGVVFRFLQAPAPRGQGGAGPDVLGEIFLDLVELGGQLPLERGGLRLGLLAGLPALPLRLLAELEEEEVERAGDPVGVLAFERDVVEVRLGDLAVFDLGGQFRPGVAFEGRWG